MAARLMRKQYAQKQCLCSDTNIHIRARSSVHEKFAQENGPKLPSFENADISFFVPHSV